MNPFRFLEETYLGNKLENYLWFLLILVIGLLIKKLISRLITATMYLLVKRYGKAIGKQKFIQLLSSPIELFLTVLIVYLAFDRLIFPSEWNLVSSEEFGFRRAVLKFYQLLLLISVFWIVFRVVDFIALFFSERAKKTATMVDDQLVPFVREAVKVVIAGIGLLIILGVVFGLDIVSLVTGLGIGGLAIALAARETLENLLGSFTIFLDKPFVTGDTVRVGAIEGKVESVGFRSTRIRAVDKMLVTVPNKKMTDAELINDSERTVRRFSSVLLLSKDTSVDQIQKLLVELRRVLRENQMVEHSAEIVRFRNILNNGFEIFIAYVVLTPDNGEFLGITESINMEILKVLNSNHISLSNPTFIKEENLLELEGKRQTSNATSTGTTTKL